MLHCVFTGGQRCGTGVKYELNAYETDLGNDVIGKTGVWWG